MTRPSCSLESLEGFWSEDENQWFVRSFFFQQADGTAEKLHKLHEMTGSID